MPVTETSIANLKPFVKGDPRCDLGHGTQKGPYLTPILKRFLNKEIDYIDPETQQKIRGRVKDAVLWRLILNATEGETAAIKEILERFDGKVKGDNDQGQVDSSTKIIIVYPPDYKPKEGR